MKNIKHIMLVSLLLFLSACNRDLADQDFPSPDISYGKEKIKTQSIVRCWGLEDCQKKQESTDDVIAIEELTNLIEAQGDSNISINFSDPKPDTINYKVRELDDEYMSVSKDDSILVPDQKGIYTYDLLVYWNTNKGQTEGEIVYSFQVERK
ncbi:hypothetical protein [Rossellomorea marisflavi]|uniref:hypothetical protein n=1 Tax=Rossellomorea marisflavi TaxID=189381 RepID=UPI00064FA6CD|nr:hypothetical protein [Rossellomorea marisflavi]KML32362.1 hypothetical protein VL12_15275 [Rossellomorea marisflavi]